MGDKGRWEYLRAIYGRYRTAGRKAKRVILNEFCANTDYNRSMPSVCSMGRGRKGIRRSVGGGAE